MSFRLKPSHFERDGPVCTRSASSFFRNPLNFCTHVIWVKWWYHAMFQPFLSSFVDAFHFQGHLAKNKSLNAWKISNEVQKLKRLRQKWNAFVKMKPLTSKEMVQFVHEVHPVFVVTVSTFAHMIYGSNDDTMPSFNLFWVHL